MNTRLKDDGCGDQVELPSVPKILMQLTTVEVGALSRVLLLSQSLVTQSISATSSL